MKKTRLAAQARLHLDRRFRAWRPIARFAPPVKGWTRAIREAFGMTTLQLARRLNITQPAVIDLERSEARGTIELATLRRLAQALDCTLVYALVPNKPLDATVRERARAFARNRQQMVEHSMALEDQKVKTNDTKARLDEILRETNPRLFWD